MRQYLPWVTPFFGLVFGVLLLLPMDSDEPFGIRTVVAPEGWYSIHWPRLQSDMQADALTVARCRAATETCTPAALRFIAIVDEARQHEGLARIGHINRAVNLAIIATRRGGPLVWNSPLTVLAEGRSDCNGFAIVKYAALADAGIGDPRLIAVYVKSVDEDHMVASARNDSRWIILDNRNMALVDSGEERDYMPKFELDTRGVRQFLSPSPNVAGLPCSGSVAVAEQDQ